MDPLTLLLLADRLLHRRKIDLQTECWIWLGYCNPTNGYGRIQQPNFKRTLYTHRVSYEIWVGPLRKGLEIDHICRNVKCFNPKHLEQVTHKENVGRGKGNGKKTHCPNGHSYTGDNVKIYKGRRYCVLCNKERLKSWHEAKRHREVKDDTVISRL